MGDLNLFGLPDQNSGVVMSIREELLKCDGVTIRRLPGASQVKEQDLHGSSKREARIKVVSRSRTEWCHARPGGR